MSDHDEEHEEPKELEDGAPLTVPSRYQPGEGYLDPVEADDRQAADDWDARIWRRLR